MLVGKPASSPVAAGFILLPAGHLSQGVGARCSARP
jgi:hypothetical protein